MRPNFEDPLDTAKQLVEKNITIYLEPGSEIWKQFLLESSIPEYRILAENLIFADDWNHFDKISINNVIGAGTHAQMTTYLLPYELDLGLEHPDLQSKDLGRLGVLRGWHRSKQKVPGHCQARVQTNLVHVNSRSLRGHLKLILFLYSLGLDQELTL